MAADLGQRRANDGANTGAAQLPPATGRACRGSLALLGAACRS